MPLSLLAHLLHSHNHLECGTLSLPRLQRREEGLCSPKEREALDHMIANPKALDFQPSTGLNLTRSMSDHYALLLAFDSPPPSLLAWHWPTPTPLPSSPPLPTPPLPCKASGLQEWSRVATSCLEHMYSCKIPSRDRLTCDLTMFKKPMVDQKLHALYKARQALQHHIATKRPNRSLTMSLSRRLLALDPPLPIGDFELVDLRDRLDVRLKEYSDAMSLASLGEWKKVACTWRKMSPKLFSYMRNLVPTQACVVRLGCEVTSCPKTMALAFHEFGGGIQRWSDPGKFEKALDDLEDRYFLTLPNSHFELTVTGASLSYHAKSASKSSPGLDAWTSQQVEALPIACWNLLAEVICGDWCSNRSLLGWFRRIPISKVSDEPPLPSQVRPIDIFSQVVRIVSSAQVQVLKGWMRQVLSPSQHATIGGISQAVGRLAFATEACASGFRPTFAVAVDFQKMFNTLSPRVAHFVSRALGLADSSATALFSPLFHTCGVWRLPFHHPSPLFRLEKGIPQGLATSVAAAEMIICTLLSRSAWIDGVESVAYMDDLHFITGSVQVLEQIL